MKHLLRPYENRFSSSRLICNLGIAVIMGVGTLMALPGAAAQATKIAQIMKTTGPLLLASSQGYLGVDLTDVDQEKAQSLKLKEMRGAVITLIDHDAPAGQIGLRVNDVVLKLNGQPVEGAEQLRRMLREIPAGRKVSLEISRDGNIQTLAVELADRRVMERDVWNKIGNSGDGFTQSPPGLGILGNGGDASIPGFHMPFFGSTLNVGALVEPLTSQMAEYLGVPSGVMVKQVTRKSEAAAAGLQAFDVILKVGNEAITNLSAWDRALRANQGKPVQVTILRDKKQQTLTLQVDSKHHSELGEIFPGENWPAVAEIGANELEQLREQMDELRDGFNAEEFKIDPQQMDELRKQMEQMKRQFKVDPKQMEELRQQMEQWKRQMEEMKALQFGNYV